MTTPRLDVPPIDIDRIRQGDPLATADAFEAYGAVLQQLAVGASVRTGRWRDAGLTHLDFAGNNTAPGVDAEVSDDNQILRQRFILIDDLMIFSLHVSGFFVKNPLVFTLQVNLPQGFRVAGDPSSEQSQPFTWLTGGVIEVGSLILSPGLRQLDLFRADGILLDPFPASNLDVILTALVEVARG